VLKRRLSLKRSREKIESFSWNDDLSLSPESTPTLESEEKDSMHQNTALHTSLEYDEKTGLQINLTSPDVSSREDKSNLESFPIHHIGENHDSANRTNFSARRRRRRKKKRISFSSPQNERNFDSSTHTSDLKKPLSLNILSIPDYVPKMALEAELDSEMKDATKNGDIAEDCVDQENTVGNTSISSFQESQEPNETNATASRIQNCETRPEQEFKTHEKFDSQSSSEVIAYETPINDGNDGNEKKDLLPDINLDTQRTTQNKCSDQKMKPNQEKKKNISYVIDVEYNDNLVPTPSPTHSKLIHGSIQAEDIQETTKIHITSLNKKQERRKGQPKKSNEIKAHNSIMNRIYRVDNCSISSNHERNMKQSLDAELSSEIFITANPCTAIENKDDICNKSISTKIIKANTVRNTTTENRDGDHRSDQETKEHVSYLIEDECNTQLESITSQANTKQNYESKQTEINPEVLNAYSSATIVYNKSRKKQKRKTAKAKSKKLIISKARNKIVSSNHRKNSTNQDESNTKIKNMCDRRKADPFEKKISSPPRKKIQCMINKQTEKSPHICDNTVIENKMDKSITLALQETGTNDISRCTNKQYHMFSNSNDTWIREQLIQKQMSHLALPYINFLPQHMFQQMDGILHHTFSSQVNNDTPFLDPTNLTTQRQLFELQRHFGVRVDDYYSRTCEKMIQYEQILKNNLEIMKLYTSLHLLSVGSASDFLANSSHCWTQQDSAQQTFQGHFNNGNLNQNAIPFVAQEKHTSADKNIVDLHKKLNEAKSKLNRMSKSIQRHHRFIHILKN